MKSKAEKQILTKKNTTTGNSDVDLLKNLDIVQVIQLAIKHSKNITRKSYKAAGSPYVIVIIKDSSLFLSVSDYSINPKSGWQPQLEDILANDWLLTD